MKGQSHALYLGKEHLSGPMIMCFSDTLIETDLSFLDHEPSDGVAWVKAVPDPRRFGVAEVNADGWVTRLVEKPQDMENNLALVGCYYFKRSRRSSERHRRADAARHPAERRVLPGRRDQHHAGTRSAHPRRTRSRPGSIPARSTPRSRPIATCWNATGSLLSGNNGHRKPHALGVKIHEPVFIHETAEIVAIQRSVPMPPLGANCRISGSVIEDSIIEADCEIIRYLP